jgi:hypothetical protein
VVLDGVLSSPARLPDGGEEERLRERRTTGYGAGRARSALVVEHRNEHRSFDPGADESGLRDKDVADFGAVRPYLSTDERNWLRAALEIVTPGHPWIPDL